MKKQIFQNIIVDFIEKPKLDIFPRELKLPVDSGKIISLSGPRRSGKTFLLYDTINRLRKIRPHNRIVYINFEDDRLFPMQLGDLNSLLEGYYELFPHNKDEKVYFFFDEIQEVEYWEKFIRRIYDQENCDVFVTGSSSKLLSREIASSLRGRTIPFQIFPLSFAEFLSFYNIEASLHSSKGKATMLYQLKKYLSQGGFPELVFVKEDLHSRIIHEYIDLMIYKDLTQRFSIKQPLLMKYLLKFLLSNIAKPMSTHNIYNTLKSHGYAISKNTVYDYLSYLEEAFAIFKIDKWSLSLKIQAINPSKIYSIDSAYKYAMSLSEDLGRVFENTLFLELKRRDKNPFYYLKKQEVDFYINETGELVNACYSLSDPKTRNREVVGMLKAMQDLEVKEGLIVTWDEKNEIHSENKTIFIRPMYEYLLNKNQ